MKYVRAKKNLGQHFLTDQDSITRIENAIFSSSCPSGMIEIGCGTGALTSRLFTHSGYNVLAIDVDIESIDFLKAAYPDKQERIQLCDFLNANLSELVKPLLGPNQSNFAVVGNFPYNISSQILFKILENKNLVPYVVGMFQKEVAQRIASPHGSRQYGILSVLMQTFYKVEYLFEIGPEAFNPPPAVKSAVIRCTRLEGKTISCSPESLLRTVKTGFNQRRKTLRNALKGILPTEFPIDHPMLNLRAEQLSPADFENLASEIEKGK